MGGMHLKRGGYVTPSKIFMESLFAERDIHWITRAHVRQLDPGVAHYETIAEPQREIAFDFAMLLPLALLNVLITALVIFYLQENS